MKMMFGVFSRVFRIPSEVKNSKSLHLPVECPEKYLPEEIKDSFRVVLVVSWKSL